MSRGITPHPRPQHTAQLSTAAPTLRLPHWLSPSPVQSLHTHTTRPTASTANIGTECATAAFLLRSSALSARHSHKSAKLYSYTPSERASSSHLQEQGSYYSMDLHHLPVHTVASHGQTRTAWTAQVRGCAHNQRAGWAAGACSCKWLACGFCSLLHSPSTTASWPVVGRHCLAAPLK